ncbi:MAG: oxidoreductase [Dehalococcoidia bacterium]|nr:MAG: oxidoreductase [Dehalococcoidia bacterium]
MADSNRFDGKVIVVTGGGSGIGEACAALFAARGGKVVVADLNLEAAERVASEIGGEARAVHVDVADPASVEAMVRFAVETFGRLDVAVNNAGIGGEANPVGSYSIEGWKQVIDVNLNGVFYGMRYEIPAMLANGGGVIVNMASILGTVGFANAPAYVAAKHAVVGLTKAAAIEYATAGIRAVSVCPAFIVTPALDQASERRGEAGHHRAPPGQADGYAKRSSGARLLLGV